MKFRNKFFLFFFVDNNLCTWERLEFTAINILFDFLNNLFHLTAHSENLSYLFSSTKIIVNKEELEELIAELRAKTPEEVKRYQKIISNKEAILADAQAKADQIIAQAQVQTNELVSEHQIMQQAYAQANEVVMIATKQAQEILDNATNEANSLRVSAMGYADDQLHEIEEVLSNSIETSQARYDSLISSLQGFLDVVTKNRAQLFPQTEAAEEAAASAGQAAESAEEPQITNISASDEDAQEE